MVDSFSISGQYPTSSSNDVDATPILSKRRRGSSIHSSDPLKKRARRLLDEDEDDDAKNRNKGVEPLVVTINRSSYEPPRKRKPKKVSQPKSKWNN